MKIFQKSETQSLICRLDPRVRVISAFAFSVLVVVLQEWTALLAGAAVVFLVAGLAHAFSGTTLRRLAELNLFTLFLFVFIPLSIPGPALVRLGGLEWSLEGVFFALRIALKANSVMLLVSSLLAGMEPADLAHALYRLRVPAKLAHALFFCVRYIEVLHLEYHRLVNAMKLRGFHRRLSRHTIRSLGYLVGMLFVRSVDRSDRILEAMKCRGFDGRLYSLAEFEAGRKDAVFTVILGAAALGISTLEWII
jgi:cobalt/nickel transport system permease protein